MARLIKLNVAALDLTGIDIESAETAEDVPIITGKQFLLNIENIVDVKIENISKEIRLSSGSHRENNYKRSLYASAKVTTIYISTISGISKYEVSQDLDTVYKIVNC